MDWKIRHGDSDIGMQLRHMEGAGQVLSNLTTKSSHWTDDDNILSFFFSLFLRLYFRWRNLLEKNITLYTNMLLSNFMRTFRGMLAINSHSYKEKVATKQTLFYLLLLPYWQLICLSSHHKCIYTDQWVLHCPDNECLSLKFSSTQLLTLL